MVRNRGELLVPVDVQAYTRAEFDERAALPVSDLPLPTPPPSGAEWIEAYRHWMGEA